MKATVRQVGQVSVVDLDGNITIGKGDVVLRDTIHRLLDGGHRNILLNLENVPYTDSSGIGELIAGYIRADKESGAVKLLKPSRKFRRVLEVNMLEDVFETFQDEKEAIDSF
jgi:anti-sigma B factor antagonist